MRCTTFSGVREELAILKGRSDGLEARLGVLEATQFSSATKLGGNVSPGLQQRANAIEDGTTFNDDLQLDLDTSFFGKDLLRIKLRAGNFANSGFGGGEPVGPNQVALFPNQLDIAFPDHDAGHLFPQKPVRPAHQAVHPGQQFIDEQHRWPGENHLQVLSTRVPGPT